METKIFFSVCFMLLILKITTFGKILRYGELRSLGQQ